MPFRSGHREMLVAALRGGFEEPRHREQQGLRISVVQVGSGQEVRTDHFRAVASRSVASLHQCRRFDRFLDDRVSGSRTFEMDNLPRFGFAPDQFLLNFLLEVHLRHVMGFVQGGCTIEVLSVPPREFR